MNRHSSNNVKMLKIAASAAKQMMKLTISERSNVASIKFGKPNAEKPRCVVCRDCVAEATPFVFAGQIEIEETIGMRLRNRNTKLSAKMKTVASHGPTYGETVPTRASDSPSSEIR